MFGIFCDWDVSINLTSPFAALDREFKKSAAEGCNNNNNNYNNSENFGQGTDDEETNEGAVLLLIVAAIVLSCGGGATYKLKRDWCGNLYLEERIRI